MKVKNCTVFVAGIVLLLIFIYVIKNVYYYKAAHEANKNLEAGGFKLMMNIDEVRNVCGKEEFFTKGFGGDFFKYPSKGVSFSVSTDTDYDLLNKISDLSITNPEYSLFGIHVGTELSEASEVLRSLGYKERISSYGDKSYTKGCVSIKLSSGKSKISEIRIAVKDKKYDASRQY